MSTKAFQQLYYLATDESLGKFLTDYQWGNSIDFDLGLNDYFNFNKFTGTKSEAITQLLLYISREKFEPTLHHSECVEKYARFDYNKLRDEVLQLVQKLNNPEWGWIDKKLAELEQTGIPEINQCFDRPDPHATLEERKDFRHMINSLIRGFK